jgi:hypothetical protein
LRVVHTNDFDYARTLLLGGFARTVLGSPRRLRGT